MSESTSLVDSLRRQRIWSKFLSTQRDFSRWLCRAFAKYGNIQFDREKNGILPISQPYWPWRRFFLFAFPSLSACFLPILHLLWYIFDGNIEIILLGHSLVLLPWCNIVTSARNDALRLKNGQLRTFVRITRWKPSQGNQSFSTDSRLFTRVA